MKRFLTAALTTFAVSRLLSPAPAAAQFQYQRPVINPRPAVNPILNLNRTSAAVNYYGVVRPQQQTFQSIQQLQQQLKDMTPALPPSLLGPEPAAIMISTGHPVQFMNTSQYFPLAGSRSGGPGGATPLTPASSSTGILRR
jgi:hypothetical protein